jgi:hypothetical protein
VQREKLLTAAIYVSRIRDTSARNHAYRLRLANKIRQLIDDFISAEVQAAVSEAKDDPAHMSWQQIADTLELSKSAVFTRYGKATNESERANHN